MHIPNQGIYIYVGIRGQVRVQRVSMLELSVKRRDGSPIDLANTETVIFYDETLKLFLQSSKRREVHVVVTIVGFLQDREREHRVVVHDEILAPNTRWDVNIYVRHPQSPLQRPRVEVSATARVKAETPGKPQIRRPSIPAQKFLVPLQPIQSARAGLVVPFHFQRPADALVANPSGGRARAISTVSTAPTTDPGNGEISRSETPVDVPVTFNEEEGAEEEIQAVRWQATLVQALELEIRSLRPALERDRVIAEMDFVAGHYPVQINVCDVALDDGLADLMGPKIRPIILQPNESYAACYNLQLRTITQPITLASSRKPLNLILECEVLLERATRDSKEGTSKESEVRPKISTTWLPVVDFEGTQGPLPKTPAIDMPMNSPMGPFSHEDSHSAKSNKPSISGFGSSLAPSSTLDLVVPSRGQSSSNLTLMGGINIIITGPQFVKVGDQFEWEIKVLNRSQRNRHFTMTFGHLSRDYLRTDGQYNSDRLAALGTYDSDYLRHRATANHRGTLSGRGIIPLSHDIKFGNLAPHVCFETKLQLKALTPGTHTIEAARIEDLTIHDSYDVGGLLEVIVEV